MIELKTSYRHAGLILPKSYFISEMTQIHIIGSFFSTRMQLGGFDLRKNWQDSHSLDATAWLEDTDQKAPQLSLMGLISENASTPTPTPGSLKGEIHVFIKLPGGRVRDGHFLCSLVGLNYIYMNSH